jgi:transcriptional/translational regulatory protein YebC/TACO1
MASHSHSSNIAARKGGRQQARRNFKLARNIMSAVRQGRSDPDHNLKLKYALEGPRGQHAPRTTSSVIKRAAGEKGGPGFQGSSTRATRRAARVMVAC